MGSPTLLIMPCLGRRTPNFILTIVKHSFISVLMKTTVAWSMLSAGAAGRWKGVPTTRWSGNLSGTRKRFSGMAHSWAAWQA